LRCQPDAFVLLILSHGENCGVILTDKLVEGSSPKDPKFETYTTSDVWNGLADLELLKSRPKIILFGVSFTQLYQY